MYHSRTLSEQSTPAVMYFTREAPSWAGQVQKQSQSSSTKGESLAHVRWHLTFGSSSRLSPEWNVHSSSYWTVETSSKSLDMVNLSLDMVNLISGKHEVEWKSVWERTVCRQWIVQCCFVSGKASSSGNANLTHWSGGTCTICWPRMAAVVASSFTSIVFPQHFIKPLNLCFWSVSKENKF